MQSKLLYITSKDAKAGSLVVALGLMELLKSRFKKVAIFKPLIKEGIDEEPDIVVIRSYFKLDQAYDICFGLSLNRAQTLLTEDNEATLYKEIITRYKQLEEKYDFILCLGLSQKEFKLVFDFDVNIEIAKNLSAPIVGVINGYEKPLTLLQEEIKLWEYSLKEQGVTLFALFLNRLCNPQKNKTIPHFFKEHEENIYFLSELEQLNQPTVQEVMLHTGAKVVYGDAEQLLRVVKGYKVAAMQVEHFLAHLQEGDLVIVPGDRVDIILAVIAANSAKKMPCAAGILLCGDFKLSAHVKHLLEGLSYVGVPIVALPFDTLESAQLAINTPARIMIENKRKIAQALGLFHTSVDQSKLVSRLIEAESCVMTPAMFTYLIFEKARYIQRRIVLPESEDERVLRAAEIITKQHIAKVILLGKKEEVVHRCGMIGVDLEGVEIVDPHDEAVRNAFAAKLYALRKTKGMSEEIAKDTLNHINYFAVMMVYMGMADGMVSGAIHTTRETIRPAFQIIGTKETGASVSSLFFMCLDTRVLVYADCAIIPDPTAEQLAQIALSSAKSARAFGIEPVVAMLSYSSGESGEGADVEKVREAAKLASSREPTLPLEGPMQYDAAIDPVVGHLKLPDSKVAGHATVFIFPDLNTGNNTYKAVQRATGAIAIGPILQGLNAPVNDLSRGCSVEDIVSTVAITACQVSK